MERPVTRNWNRPLLFDVPASFWREGENVTHARLAVHPHFGTMAPIIVGPREPFNRITIGASSPRSV